ncbi:hypothetical protein LTR64_003415 [Lithohypha guttulata]|uniref:uncharacterized protein n=1 Tax=Lithohypha guttulata TaxID=1690604 RepID=UPI00315D52CE
MTQRSDKLTVIMLIKYALKDTKNRLKSFKTMAAATMAPTSSSFVHSTTNFDAQDTNTSGKTLDAQASMASGFLLSKMVEVLRNVGYDDKAVETVSSLVSRNTVEAENIYIKDFLNDVERTGNLIDEKLLDRGTLASRGLSLNSNEPVLLVELAESTELTMPEIRDLKDKILNTTRTRGIKPVRVYVRLSAEADSAHFGVCLINVVNTDIGGPSMIQLLDAAFHDAGWKDQLAVKEAYNGSELLWRDQRAVVTSCGVPPLSASADAAEPVESTESEDVDGTPSQIESGDFTVAEASEEIAVPAQPAKHRDVNSVSEDVEETEVEANEHPAMKALRESDARRAAIQHPTWSRDHEDEGLLDIITTQSANAEGTQPMSIISGDVSKVDDDFEMVEKT